MEGGTMKKVKLKTIICKSCGNKTQIKEFAFKSGVKTCNDLAGYKKGVRGWMGKQEVYYIG
jgi:transcription elongation factor Elf1